jgi:hypothetical protein
MARQNIRNFLGIAALFLWFAGCSASGSKFPDSPFATQPVPTDKSRIVFYRDPDTNFRAATIAIDGSTIGAVSHHGFIVAKIAPGGHKITAWVRGFFQEFVLDMKCRSGKDLLHACRQACLTCLCLLTLLQLLGRDRRAVAQEAQLGSGDLLLNKGSLRKCGVSALPIVDLFRGRACLGIWVKYLPLTLA